MGPDCQAEALAVHAAEIEVAQKQLELDVAEATLLTLQIELEVCLAG